MSSYESIGREARSQRGKKRFILVALGVVLFLSMLAVRPLLDVWRVGQGNRHLAEAHRAVERRDFLAALNAVHHAASHIPNDPEMLRTAARALVGLNAHPDEILSTLSQIEAVGGMTPEMFLTRAEAQLSRGDLGGAQQALSALPEDQRQTWKAVELEADLLVRQGRSAEAGQRLQSSRESGDTPEAIFRRAVLDLAVAQDGAQRVAPLRIIWETAAGSESGKLLALTLLCQDAGLTASEAGRVLDLVNRMPEPVAPQLRHAALAAVFRLAPERKEALILEESERAAKLPTKEQLIYLLFLTKQQAPEAMQAFLTTHGQALAKERPADFFDMELEALAGVKDWEAVRLKLKTKEAQRMSGLALNLWEACTTAALDATSPRVLEQLKLAYAAKENGQNHNGALHVADCAMGLGQPAFAASCYEELAAKPLLQTVKAVFLEKATAAHTQARDTAGLRRTAHALAELTPGHLLHAHRSYYLDILCDQPLDVIVHRLSAEDAAVASDPAAKARRRLLWSLIYHRRKQTEILHRELEGMEQATTTWTVGERAVLAGLLAAAGEPARAWQLAENLPSSLLLPEEAELLKLARE